jgi:hypothetical protein
MNNKTTAKNYAKGQYKGNNNNKTLFFKDGSIYSYGLHFKIAEKLKGNKYAFNIDSYSKTTAKHKNIVLKALEEARADIIKTSFNQLNY